MLIKKVLMLYEMFYAICCYLNNSKNVENAHGRDLLALREAFLFSGENHFRHEAF